MDRLKTCTAGHPVFAQGYRPSGERRFTTLGAQTQPKVLMAVNALEIEAMGKTVAGVMGTLSSRFAMP
jgi:hypothetical protein